MVNAAKIQGTARAPIAILTLLNATGVRAPIAETISRSGAILNDEVEGNCLVTPSKLQHLNR